MQLIPIPGDVVDVAALTSTRAHDMVRYIQAHHTPYIRLVECRKRNTLEILVIDLDVEIATRRPVPIQGTERLAVMFVQGHDELPQVMPLRQDFPLEQLHISLSTAHEFATLCLWEDSFENLKGRLTSYMFLARVKEWLELSAEGKLHQPGQPLEPVLTGVKFRAILPAGKIDPQQPYMAEGYEMKDGAIILRFKEEINANSDKPKFALIQIEGPPIVGRAVRLPPATLGELVTLLKGLGTDFAAKFLEWSKTYKLNGVANVSPVVLLAFPKKRDPQGPVEGTETWAFCPAGTVADIGKKSGLFDVENGFMVPILNATLDVAALGQIAIDTIYTTKDIEPSLLGPLSGNPDDTGKNVTAIGVGALGSKVLECLVRGGFGRWTIIDDDCFLPHNTVRHVLGKRAIGYPKSGVMSHFLTEIVPGNPVSKVLEDSAIANGELNPAVKDAVTGADLLLDMSASVPVARILASAAGETRCASLFLNPGGRDLVILLEDAQRTINLIDLEAGYYAALITNPGLAGHLVGTGAAGVRYGNGCRDITATISAAQVSLLGGLAATAIRRLSANNDAASVIWRSQDDGAVNVTTLQPPRVQTAVTAGWSVGWSADVIQQLRSERAADLPNETGGVLVAMVDFGHKLIRICAAVPAPEDSKKRPYCFERGSEHLWEAIAIIEAKTAGQLRYLGEWHSHPDGAKAAPSGDDNELFDKMGTVFHGTGEPFIMAIVGQSQIFFRIGYEDKVEEATFDLPQ